MEGKGLQFRGDVAAKGRVDLLVDVVVLEELSYRLDASVGF